MRRIAFRRLLPIVQLVLAAGLLVVGNAQLTAPRTVGEDALSLPGRVPPADLPPAFEIAVGINAPAFLGSLPIFLLVLAIFGGESWVHYLVAAVGILAFWFLVGTHIDRTRGLLSPRIKKPPRRATRLFAWAGLFICPILAVFSFKTIFELQGWHGEHDVYNYVGYSLWMIIAAVVLALKLRQWRALARATTSNTPHS